MKREDLEKLGLTKEQIDSVMAENGKDIEKHKGDAETAKTTLSQAQKQLEDANKAIEDFKKLDVDGIKAAADKYKTDYEKAQEDHKIELEKIAYNSAAEKFIDSLKPKDGLSKSAILSEFAKKEFKLDGESFQGATEWAESFKKDNASHFIDGKPEPGIFAGPTGGNQNLNMDAFTAAAMKAAGVGEEKKG